METCLGAHSISTRPTYNVELSKQQPVQLEIFEPASFGSLHVCKGDELEPPVKVAWLTLCAVNVYHILIESKIWQNPSNIFKMLAKVTQVAQAVALIAAECFIFAYSCSYIPNINYLYIKACVGLFICHLC